MDGGGRRNKEKRGMLVWCGVDVGVDDNEREGRVRS